MVHFLVLNILTFLYIIETKLGQCIPLNGCDVVLETLINNTNTTEQLINQIRHDIRSNETVCNSKLIQKLRTKRSTKKKLIPDRRFCGYQHTDDYVYTGNDTSIDEFPWLAVFKYQKDSDLDEGFVKEFYEFGCAGTLITDRFVLTAAQCLRLATSSAVAVRLGEYNIKQVVDCIKFNTIDDCSNPTEDIEIEKKIRHPKYVRRTGINDIALVQLKRRVTYSDYIRPICLPFNGTKLAKDGEVMVLSGFGRLNTNDDYAAIKKRIKSVLISNELCTAIYNQFPNRHRNVTDNIICTQEYENKTVYACEGDSGGPLMISRNNQFHIEGIAVWSAVDCGIFPFAHTRVVNYLDWITKTIEANSLLN